MGSGDRYRIADGLSATSGCGGGGRGGTPQPFECQLLPTRHPRPSAAAAAAAAAGAPSLEAGPRVRFRRQCPSMWDASTTLTGRCVLPQCDAGAWGDLAAAAAAASNTEEPTLLNALLPCDFHAPSLQRRARDQALRRTKQRVAAAAASRSPSPSPLPASPSRVRLAELRGGRRSGGGR
eukprot:Rhum_TRINITY_DN5472_c0_g1::Rhum_TRINITY_DN5472_c0_g1_i1::g.17379::m.17379